MIRRLTWFAVLSLGVALTIAALRRPSPSAPVSRGDLAASFNADLRRVVYAWEPSDPRPDDQRLAALFDFMYETYDASAWIPQSLFDSNLFTQAVVGDVDTIVRDKVGLVLWNDNARVPAFGMAPNADTGQPLRWTVNCLVCHTAEIDGVAVVRAGRQT